MKLDRIDPHLLAALGLMVACGPKSDTDTSAGDGADTAEVTSSACLSAPLDDDGGTTTALPTGTSVGPCLGQDIPATTTGTDGGTTTSSSTGTSSGSDTGATGSGTGDPGTSSGGICLAGIAPDHEPGALGGESDVVQRVLSRGVLPQDVADRLRRKG